MIRVLIPTDFSVNSLNALTYAHMLFQEEPVTFTLLHAYEPTALQILGHQTPVRLASLYHSLKVQAIEELESLKEEILIKNEIAHHSYEVVAYGSHLNDAIKSMSDQKIDYIVMGSKGATGLKEIFIGTITHSVISYRHNIPLLVVPEKATFVIPKSIGFATDFEKPYHKEEFEPLLLLTRLWQATIRMVEVYEEHNLNQKQKEHIQDLESLLQEMKYRFHVIPKFSTLENCIHIFDEELQIDLLVIIDYPKSFFEKLMREPVIKKMSFHTSLPFLVLPAHS